MESRPETLVHQQAALAKPTDTRKHGEVAFEQRTRVHKNFLPAALAFQQPAQRCEAFGNPTVIVASLRECGDTAGNDFLSDRHTEGDDGASILQVVARIDTMQRLASQPSHVRVTPVLKPMKKNIRTRGFPRRRKTHGGKTRIVRRSDDSLT